jgi:hypothetical protein
MGMKKTLPDDPKIDKDPEPPKPMVAAVYGSSYMEIAGPLTPTPPNAAEAMPNLPAAFVTAWNQTKYAIPAEWEGDPALIAGMAVLAGRYQSGTGVTTPAITTIAPTSTAHAASFTLTVNGTNFDFDATVVVGIVDVTTNHVSNVQLTASVPASAIALAGVLPVTVRNGNGVVSNATNLTLT